MSFSSLRPLLKSVVPRLVARAPLIKQSIRNASTSATSSSKGKLSIGLGLGGLAAVGGTYAYLSNRESITVQEAAMPSEVDYQA